MISCWSHSVLYNTGINTGIPVLIFLNTEIPVLPNGPTCDLWLWRSTVDMGRYYRYRQ